MQLTHYLIETEQILAFFSNRVYCDFQTVVISIKIVGSKPNFTCMVTEWYSSRKCTIRSSFRYHSNQGSSQKCQNVQFDLHFSAKIWVWLATEAKVFHMDARCTYDCSSLISGSFLGHFCTPGTPIFFLAVRGASPPSNPQTEGGHIPPLDPVRLISWKESETV